MIKLFFNKPKMTQQLIFIVVVIFCLMSESPRAFVTAQEDISDAMPEFDPTTRGTAKFGDKCNTDTDCGFPGSDCYNGYCSCAPQYKSTNHVDKCGKPAALNESCYFNEQCEESLSETECRDNKCICRFEKVGILKGDGSYECVAPKEKEYTPPTQVNPAMYLILVVMALMFIIICVVLRLFSKARWRENRTIFNTPNPRLMNVSLLHNNKLLHGQERRGSRMSVRMPSRQPSMASLRPHSPNASLQDYFPETNIEIERYLHFTDTHKGSSRRGSRNSSSASATSVRSNRSLQHHRPSEQYHTTHTVVTNPNQLFSVNQQQHMQHQLMIHQQTQRRRSSISQSVLQHAAQVAASSNINNLQTQKQLIEEDTQTAIQLPKDHVKVEITEVKP